MQGWPVRIAESPADYERVMALFGEIEGPEEVAYCQERLMHLRYRPELTRYIELDGRVVCAVLLRHDRWLVDGAPLDVGFVENILTHPEYRGRGLFTALLQDSLTFLRGEAFALASLHGPVTLYARLGYAPVRYHSAVTLPAVQATALPSNGRARPFTRDDIGEVSALYAANYGPLAGSEERTAGVWHGLSQWKGALVIEGANRSLTAYAKVEQRFVRRKLRVVEAAAADGQAAAALLQALGRQAQEEGLEEVYLPLAPEHPVARAVLAAGGKARLVGPQAQGSHWGHEDQARVVDLSAALTALAPALSRRLSASIYAGWQGNIAIDTDEGSASLEIDANGVRGTARDGVTQGVLRLPARLLAPLFLGTLGARELVAQPGVEANVPLLGLLGALFPPRWPVSENEDWWIEID